MPIAIDSRVLCSSQDMEVTSYDAMDYRPFLVSIIVGLMYTVVLAWRK